MIFDCFTFFNEFDLLNLRLNELDDVVDYFVLVEGVKTFSGLPKQLFFDKNKHKFKKFLPKIKHIVFDENKSLSNAPQIDVESLPKGDTQAWINEVKQRNAILEGIVDAGPDDVILISDVDEIPNKEKFSRLKDLSGSDVYNLELKLYYYYFNCRAPDVFHSVKAVLKQAMTTPHKIRYGKNFKTIRSGGWHFSYLGGAKNISQKINSFSHQEFNTKEINNLKKIAFNISNRLDIFNRPSSLVIEKIDHSYPGYLVKHLARYKKDILKLEKADRNTLLLRKEILGLRRQVAENQHYRDKYDRLLKEYTAIISSRLYKILCSIRKLFRPF